MMFGSELWAMKNEEINNYINENESVDVWSETESLQREDLVKNASDDNADVRRNAFVEMGKLLNAHQELMVLHLSDLIRVSSEGLHDDFGFVRNEARNICCLLLENTPEKKLLGHSVVLLQHLCYAMSSNNQDVRTDSLRVLALSLRTIPAIITSSDELLESFLTLISFNQRYEVNAPHWKATILLTFVNFLKIFVDRLSKRQEKYLWPKFGSPIKIPGHKQLRSSDIKLRFEKLMLSLFNSWIVPTQGVISLEDAEVTHAIVQVIYFILEWIKIIDEKKKNHKMFNWFSENYKESIIRNFMACFPYTQHPPVVCLPLNLAICDVYSMMLQNTDSNSTRLDVQINQFLVNVMICDDRGRVAEISIILKILKNFLVSSKLENFKPFLTALLRCYKDTKKGGKDRKDILDFFIDIIFKVGSQNVEFFNNMAMVKDLCHSLLQDLLKMHQNKTVEEHTLSIIKQLNVIGFQPFITELQENSFIIIELIKSDHLEIKNTAVYLIGRLTLIQMDYFSELAKTIFNFSVPVKTIVCLTGALSSSLKRPLHDPVFSETDYINFLICLALGMRECEAGIHKNMAQSEQDKNKDVIPFHLTQFLIAQSSVFQYHLEVTQVAVRNLKSLPDQKLMALRVRSHLKQFVSACKSFAAHTAIAILHLHHEINCPPDDVDWLLVITELTIACILYQDSWEQGKEPEQIHPGCLIRALFNIIRLNDIRDVFKVILQRITDLGNVKQVESIGRLMLVVLKKGFFLTHEKEIVVSLVEKTVRKCNEVFGLEVRCQQWWQDIRRELDNIATLKRKH